MAYYKEKRTLFLQNAFCKEELLMKTFFSSEWRENGLSLMR